MRGRFIVGTGRNGDPAYAGNTTYQMGDTGGEEEHTLTQEEMPAHNHNHSSQVGSGTNPRSNGRTNSRTHSHDLNYRGVSFGTTGTSEGILVSEDRRENLLTSRGMDRIEIDDVTMSFLIASNGGDQPHENRPPYYALAYIMRMSP